MKIDWEYAFTGKRTAKPAPMIKIPEVLTSPFGLTNLAIRVTWQVSAGIIAISVRIIAALIRAIARGAQRDRKW